MKPSFLLMIFLSFPIYTRSQPRPLNGLENREFDCPYRSLSYFKYTDTTRRQAVLDSVNLLMVGKWRLVRAEPRGYVSMPTPEQEIEMEIDSVCNATIYRLGKKEIEFHLSAGINYNNIRCVIGELGMAYFHFISPLTSNGEGGLPEGEPVYRNGLRICEEYLVIFAFTSAGPGYNFHRLSPIHRETE